MRKYLAISTLLALGFLIGLSSPRSVSAATVSAGPVGINGLRAYPGPGVGQVTLEWARATLTGENYSIRYGTQSGSYPFVAPYVGYIATYTVSGLTPGQTYYFTLERIQIGNVSLGWNGEVAMTAPAFSASPVVTSGPIGRNLLTATSIGNGQVRLNWREFFSDTNGWHIVYGTLPGKPQWGVLNAVSARSSVLDYDFTVGALPRGQRVYFALAPIRGGTAMYITAEVSAFVQ